MRFTVALTITTLVVSSTVTGTAQALRADGGSAAAAGSSGWASAGTGTSSRRLTLITGDQVDVEIRNRRPERVRFRPGSGPATVSSAGGRLYAVPASARAGIASGRLDRRLFDVTTLLAELGDDAKSPAIPVIVEYAGGRDQALRSARSAWVPGGSNGRLLASIGARAEQVRKDSATTFWNSLNLAPGQRAASAVRRISLDRRVRAALDWSVPQIGAPAAARRGLTGRGVKVAVLDSGIDPSHPDLKGRIAAARNFSDAADAVDHAGHGTHVAGTIAGTGAASKGRYRGVAPAATLLNGKVLDDEGMGSESTLVAGMEWAAAQGADVVNLSVGTEAESDGTDPVSRALDDLSRRTGTLFVVAAGNCFRKDHTIGSPAAAGEALTVANLERGGTVNATSCRGPRRDGVTKPELAAPGTGIVAARAKDTAAGDPVDANYTSLSGTSMATPHVAGTAALLVQQHKDWTGAQVKARLISTADPQRAQPVDSQGSGRVDADQATDGTTSVDHATLEFGSLLWPHPDPKPVSHELTYRNPGKIAVTLKLTAPLDSGDPGRPATLSATELVIPAGGKATVRATVAPGASKVGRHTGRIIATPRTGKPLVTTYGWFLEPEMYDVTVHGRYPDGSPADNELLFVTRPDGGPADDFGELGGPEMFGGVATMRIAPGTYSISSAFYQPATDSRPDTFALVALPQVRIAKTTTVTLDARRAVPVRVTAAGARDLRPAATTMSYWRHDVKGRTSGFEEVDAADAPVRMLAAPTAKVSVGRMEFSAGTRLGTPAYRLRLGRRELVAGEIPDGPRVSGSRQLTVADAGTGRPEQLAKAAGKLALIAADPEADFGELAMAAQRAKAAGALFYHPQVPGLPTNPESFGTLGATIPVLRTSRMVAKNLPGRVVTIEGVKSSPVVYDLLKAWPDRVPVLAVHVAPGRELARLDESYSTHTSTTPLWESRVGHTPLGASHGLSVRTLSTGPAHRVSYVTADIDWDQRLAVGDSASGAAWVGSATKYAAGERRTIQWGGPVVNSGLPVRPTRWPSEQGVRRNGTELAIGIAPFTQGPEHYEEPGGQPGIFRLALRRNGKLLVEADDVLLSGPVPVAPGNYQLSLDARRSEPWWKFSTRVASTWDFRSRGGARETMPLILADVALPGNRVQAGKPARLTVGLRHQTGAPAARFTAVNLAVSSDGKTWVPVRLKGADGNYTAAITHPADQAGRPVSLRLAATDAAGGRLQQQITNAYTLRR